MIEITQENVDRSLNQAIENGYMLDLWDAEDIAEDLHEYDSDFEDTDPNDLVPFVRDWKSRRPTA